MATDVANATTPPRRTHHQHVHYLRRNHLFSDILATATSFGAIPAGGQILNTISGVFVSTVFNAATTNTLDIGTAAAAALYMTDAALGTKAFVTLDELATAANVNAWYVSADTVITFTLKLTGTAATTGAATTIIAFCPNQ